VSFLFDLVVGVLLRTAVWLGVLVILSGAVASLPWAAWGRPALGWRIAVLAGVAGALLAASLAHRFGFPDPGSIEAWRRPLYPAWSAGGALAGSAAAILVALRRARAHPEGV